MSIAGSAIGGIFAGAAAAASSSYRSNSSAGFFAFLAFVGFLTALIGWILVIKGMYRAMVKIDALAVLAAPGKLAGSSMAPVAASPKVLTQTPQHLVYHEQRSEQQPPVQ